MRVLSLLPSATEIVCALGAEAELVGISHECDFPASIHDRPVLTASRIDVHGSSRAIDSAVRAALVVDALSIYTIDGALLASLRPDVIITQDLCEVCAVALDDVRAAVARIAQRDDVVIVSLRPTCLDEVMGDVERVARALGRADLGRAVRLSLEARMEAVASRARAISVRPRVVSIEWLDPVMLGGTWMPELIERAGGVAIGARAGEPARTVSSAELAALAPDVVVIKPCGFTIERTMHERDVIDALCSQLPPETKVYVADGNAFFNRPGPRLVESLEIMAACVHPTELPDLAAKHAGDRIRLATPRHH